MSDVETFGVIILIAGLATTAAVLSHHVSERLQIPAPAIFLVCAAAAAYFRPSLADTSIVTVERIVTLAVAAILFDGGMHIGWRRLRAALGAIALLGVVGTFVTAGALAIVAHVGFGLGWWVSLLLGTAIAPTDPAVVFSVLGRREVIGRSGTILEGESGANDPVGIALLASLLAAGGLSAGAVGGVAGEFTLQMVVGAAIGALGGIGLMWFMRSVPLPSEALYPLRALAGGFVIFGLASVVHGSGFLAIFVAGVVLGDGRAPYKGEIERFVAAVASFGEIVAFVVLGLTVDLETLARRDVWLVGLTISIILVLVIRPILVGLVMFPIRLRGAERAFILWSGLKGAVPILLGTFLLTEHIPESQRLYGIVVIVVIFSVVVQGSLVPLAAQHLRIPMRTREPEPWALGVRLRDEPQGVHRHQVETGSAADGSTIADLPISSDDVWVSFVVRESGLVRFRGSTRLLPGDQVVILADPALRDDLAALFAAPGHPDKPH
ncbi:MAG: cation:proton antiporter [Nocardioidaceae bacterium]